MGRTNNHRQRIFSIEGFLHFMKQQPRSEVRTDRQTPKLRIFRIYDRSKPETSLKTSTFVVVVVVDDGRQDHWGEI